MIIPEPNLAYRTSRRFDVEGFERLLRLSIERSGEGFSAERPVSATGVEPVSLDDLARITHEGTHESYRLDVFSNEPYDGIGLPWSLYEPKDGDIYVFGPGARLTVQLTERRGHNTYAPVQAQTIAEPQAALGFLYRLSDSLYEAVRGDTVIVSKPGRLRNIAKAVVRPKRNHTRVLN